VRGQLAEHVQVSFETQLDQPEALARLARPGTLVVMPSFEETFGNTVRECLDYGIPFVASNAAALRELVAAEDQERVLFEPTGEGVARALQRVLEAKTGWQPARAAFDPDRALTEWQKIVQTQAEPPAPAAAERPAVDVARGSRAQPAAPPPAGSAPFVLFVADEDEADGDLIPTLVRGQHVSDADVVTCAVRVGAQATSHFFHGQPRRWVSSGTATAPSRSFAARWSRR
jgi:hypothetical protein